MAANRDVEKFAGASELWGWRRSSGRRGATGSKEASKDAATLEVSNQDALYPSLEPLLQTEGLQACLRGLVEDWKRTSIHEAVSSHPEATKLLARLVRLEHVVLSPCGEDIVRLFVRLMTTLRGPDGGVGSMEDGDGLKKGAEALDAKIEAMKIRSESFACERLHAAIRGVKHDSKHPLYEAEMGSLSLVEEMFFDEGFSHEEIQQATLEEALAALSYYIDRIDDEDSCYLLRSLGVMLLHSSKFSPSDQLRQLGESMLRKGYTNRREDDYQDSKAIVFILETAKCISKELEVFLLANDRFFLWTSISRLRDKLFSKCLMNEEELKDLVRPFCEASLQSPWVLEELVRVFDASLAAIRRQDYNIHRILFAIRQSLADALRRIPEDETLHWTFLYPHRSNPVLQYFHRRSLFLFDRKHAANLFADQDVKFLKELVFVDTALGDRLSLWVTCNHAQEMNEQLLSFILRAEEGQLQGAAMRLYAWLIEPLRSFDGNMQRVFIQCRQLWLRFLPLQTREAILQSRLLEQVADAIFEEPELACAWFLYCILETGGERPETGLAVRGSLMSLMCVLLYIKGGRTVRDMDSHTQRFMEGWGGFEALEQTVKSRGLRFPLLSAMRSLMGRPIVEGDEELEKGRKVLRDLLDRTWEEATSSC
eukprot:753975-Hanusia_phi.AAC.2